MATIKTSPFVGELRGSLGNVAFRRTRTGLQMVERVSARDPRTPAQVAVRERMAAASRTWKGMTLEQAAAWRRYASGLAAGPLEPSPNPTSVFCRLATRVLSVDASATIPLLPPTEPFGGDAVRAEVFPAPGAVQVRVIRGNSPGVVTEVLLQKLESVHRAAYSEKYRSAEFSEWTTGEDLALPVKAGVYAVAIRVIETATGQAGPLLELGRVVV